jgi:hypothetical protein
VGRVIPHLRPLPTRARPRVRPPHAWWPRARGPARPARLFKRGRLRLHAPSPSTASRSPNPSAQRCRRTLLHRRARPALSLPSGRQGVAPELRRKVRRLPVLFVWVPVLRIAPPALAVGCRLPRREARRRCCPLVHPSATSRLLAPPVAHR